MCMEWDEVIDYEEMIKYNNQLYSAIVIGGTEVIRSLRRIKATGQETPVSTACKICTSNHIPVSTVKRVLKKLKSQVSKLVMMMN